MKIGKLLVLLLVLVSVAAVHGHQEDISSKLRVKRSTATVVADVVRIAKSKIGETEWAKASRRLICLRSFRNKYKCNIFVADMYRDAGVRVPMRRSWCYSPIGANEWANTQSTYLVESSCWTLETIPQTGDVAAFDGHMGIVTGNLLTTSADSDSVVENDWGFRSGQTTVFWRYTC